MTDKQLKLIYEYMGWERTAYWWCDKCQAEIGGHNVTYNETCCICGFPIFAGGDKTLDSNAAWECVQEMERKAHTDEFEMYMIESWSATETFDCLLLWQSNPTNFFNCMASWLESKEDKCEVNSYLSCVCSKGTKSCDKIHKSMTGKTEVNQILEGKE